MSNIIKTNDFPVKSRPSRRKAALISGLAIGVILLGVAVVAIIKAVQNDDVAETTQVCSPELIKRASEKIEASDIAAINPIAKEIRSQKHFERDANCQYILVRFALMRRNVNEARTEFAQMKKVYVALSPAFTGRVFSLTELQEIIDDTATTKKYEEEQSAAQQEENSELDALAEKTPPKEGR